ncbi:MAG: ABC transporter permease [Salinivirgaceae bacterium]|nr:ABC transporter permease [Salinivirgaceae bacterium]
MIKYMLVQSFRRILNDKANSLLKLVGLTISLSLAFVITVFSVHELSYDNFHANADNIYRVVNKAESSDITWATTPFVLGETLLDNFPEIKENVHVFSINKISVKKGLAYIEENNVIAAEASFFNIFSYNLLHGDLELFAKTPNGLILSKSKAFKYFNNYYPVGELLTVDFEGELRDLVVCGIMEDFPKNSSLKTDIITNIDFGFDCLMKKYISSSENPPTKEELKTAWNMGVFFTNFIMVENSTSIINLQNKIANLSQQVENLSSDYNFKLQPLSDIYFNSNAYADNLNLEKGSKALILILILLGFLILLIASINYINLTVAQIFVKNHFIAIRKVCGARRRNLISQITIDSIVFIFLTVPVALLLTFVLLPIALNVLGKEYQLLVFDNGLPIIIIIGLVILIGAASGFLIGLRTTSYNAIKSLKNQMLSSGNFGFRKVLVIFQMVVSVCLITLVLFIYKQTNYSVNKDLGFNKEHLLIINFNSQDKAPNYLSFKQAIKSNPNISNVSGSMFTPPHISIMSLTLPKVNEPEKIIGISGLFTDYNFENTLGLELLKGAFPDKEKGINGVVVNELAARELGLTSAVGEQTSFGEVVGVVKNFHISSTHNLIPPVMIVKNQGMVREMIIKTSGSQVFETIGYLKKTWSELGGKGACEVSFFDTKVQELYIADMKFARLIMGCAILAILIAVLGLVGLALFMIKQKIKEVGIRKVNGAKVSEILALLNKDFIVWTIISFFIALPLIYLLVNKWLEGFAYKTAMSWWIFVLGGLITLVFTILTISLQTFRAARQNPIEALRYE